MRLYKKITLFVTMGIMGVGLASFSFSSNTSASSLSSPETEVVSLAEHEVSGDPVSIAAPVSQDSVQGITSVPSSGAVTTPVSALEPTPTPVPTNDLLKNEYPEVNKLINSYFDAKLKCTKKSFKGLVNDLSYLELKKLQKKTEYIKSYKNINTYTKRGINEIDYVVYVTYNIEVTTIDQLAPAIDLLLVSHTEDGTPQIYLGETDAETEAYIMELNKGEDVQKLITKTDKAAKKAMKKDSSLADFNKKLLEVDKETEKKTVTTKKKTETEKETEKKTETTKKKSDTKKVTDKKTETTKKK